MNRRRLTADEKRGLEIDDVLWSRIAAVLPTPPPPKSGRQRTDDRACLNGILYVLATGIGWNVLPQLLGYGSGMTCWRRLDEWRTCGVWPQVREVLEAGLRDADRVDWDRAQVQQVQRYQQIQQVRAGIAATTAARPKARPR